MGINILQIISNLTQPLFLKTTSGKSFVQALFLTGMTNVTCRIKKEPAGMSEIHSILLR